MNVGLQTRMLKRKLVCYIANSRMLKCELEFWRRYNAIGTHYLRIRLLENSNYHWESLGIYE